MTAASYMPIVDYRCKLLRDLSLTEEDFLLETERYNMYLNIEIH